LSELPLKIELELFEQVRAASETELLRVALRVSGDDRLDSRPTLLLERDDRTQRRLPILAPTDIDGVLRAAYAVSTDRLAADTKFALEFEGGTIVDLPAPIPGQARATMREGGSSRSGSEEPAAARTKAELRSELVVAREQAAVAQSREIELAALAIEAGAAAAELQAECERLSALNAELDLAPTDDSAVAAATEAGRREAEEKAAAAINAAEAARRGAEERAAAAINAAEAARRRAEEARQRAGELEERAGELERAAREAEESAAGLASAVADAERINAELEHKLTSERETRSQLEQSVAHTRDELRLITLERGELTRQVTAYDGVAVKARERAAHADKASAAASSALRELENWRTDLERRLAETTAELVSSRTARQTAETEVRELRGVLAEAEARVELAEGRSGTLAAELREAKLETGRQTAEQRANEDAERELRDAAAARRSS
jgi:chromosome segregation ATPase